VLAEAEQSLFELREAEARKRTPGNHRELARDGEEPVTESREEE
jgi:hypothetical protein